MLFSTIIVALLSLASLSSAAKECPKIVTQNPFDITKVSLDLFVLINSIDIIHFYLVCWVLV
jgi:hypothetical protein